MVEPASLAEGAAQQAYQRARRKALIGGLLARLKGRENRLLAFHDLHEQLRVGGPIYRGVQSVPLAQVVGSVDRYKDFDRAFNPAQTFTEQRWQRVGTAMVADIKLPPVKLYKAGDVYFVIDGNHRVSVARELGQEFIDAEVLEYRLRVPIFPDMDVEALAVINDKAAFLVATRLDETRPEMDFTVTIREGYQMLYDHVAVHQHLQSQEWRRVFAFEEAAGQWADQVYLPLLRVIRDAALLEDFPGRTETDLYLWLIEHLFYLRERYGDVDPLRAAREFANHYSPRLWKRLWHHLTHHILQGGSPRADELRSADSK